MKLPMHVVFGPSPESYYVACGRYAQTKGMPVAFANKMNECTVVSWSWISMGPNCETWVASNTQDDTFQFNVGLNANIHSYLAGTNNHAKSNFVTFSAEPGFWFIKHKSYGWYAHVTDFYEKEITATRNRIGGFDEGLKGILFGYGGNHIYMFQSIYDYHLEGDARNSEHPLSQVLTEFRGRSEQWSIEPGSCLCFYDDRYFFLKFKRVGEGNIEIRWNLPLEMQAKLSFLIEKAKTPEEQYAIGLEDLSLTNAVMARQTVNFSLQMAQMNLISSMNSNLCQMIAGW